MDVINFGFDADRMEAHQAAHYLGISLVGLARDRIHGNLGGIPFYRVGRRVFYRKTALDDWVAAQLKDTPLTLDPLRLKGPINTIAQALERHLSPVLKCLDLPDEQPGAIELRCACDRIVDAAETMAERLEASK
jgi:hypothetical protein